MNQYSEKSPKSASQSINKNSGNPAASIEDNRAEAAAQLQLKEIANSASGAVQLKGAGAVVAKIIVDQLGVSAEEITPEASFVDDLGADELDVVELMMEFEKHFDAGVPDNIKTVGDVIAALG